MKKIILLSLINAAISAMTIEDAKEALRTAVNMQYYYLNNFQIHGYSTKVQRALDTFDAYKNQLKKIPIDDYDVMFILEHAGLVVVKRESASSLTSEQELRSYAYIPASIRKLFYPHSLTVCPPTEGKTLQAIGNYEYLIVVSTCYGLRDSAIKGSVKAGRALYALHRAVDNPQKKIKIELIGKIGNLLKSKDTLSDEGRNAIKVARVMAKKCTERQDMKGR